MSPGPVIKNLRVNGRQLPASFAENIADGELVLSMQQHTAFDFTVLDTLDLSLTGQAGKVFRDGTVMTWEGYIFGLSAFTTGGGTKHPTIEVVAESDFVRALKDEKGGKSWGSVDVSAWAEQIITAEGAKAIIQPGLGEASAEREENKENPDKGQSTWDVLAEIARKMGLWLFEYGSTIVMGKPSWLVSQAGLRQYTIQWDSWFDHTDGLTAAPQYSWNREAEVYEGKETLVVQAIDPGEGSSNPLTKARPGDLLRFHGKGNPSEDPLWVVREVRHPMVTGRPVRIMCWRPADPPEIKEGGGLGEEGGSAGVPQGPLGAANWNGEQLVMASEIVKESQRRGLPRIAAVMAVMCAMQESSLRNKNYGDWETNRWTNPDGSPTTSLGLFQQQDTWGSRSDRLSPGKSSGLFYDQLVKHNYRAVNDGASAGSIIQTIQGSAHPDAYTKWWSDANLIVDKCIEAGEDADDAGEPLKGPLGQKIEGSMKAMEGKLIEFDGAFMYQCVDVAKQYVADLTGIRNAMGNGNQWWKNPALSQTFTAVSASKKPRKGDLVSWSGSSGAYPNGGVGHVAVYSHSKNGTHYFLSQNPGPARIQPLSTLGVLGWMRPREK